MAAEEVEAEAMTGFYQLTSAFSAWLGEQANAQLAARSSFGAQIAALKGFEEALSMLMRERPE